MTPAGPRVPLAHPLGICFAGDMTENESDNPQATVEVVPQPEQNRYALLVDGEEVGFTVYTDRGIDRVFLHTEIDPAQEGHGYGSTLIKGTLEQVRDAGLRAVAICPFVERYVEKHHDFDDIIDPVSIELRASL